MIDNTESFTLFDSHLQWGRKWTEEEKIKMEESSLLTGTVKTISIA